MDVANKFFPRGDAIGQEISISGIPYRVIGTQVAKGTVFGRPMDNFVMMPIKTFGAAFGGLTNSRAPSFSVTAKYPDRFDDAVEEVRTLMVKRKIPFGEKDNFGIMTPDAISGLRDRIFRIDLHRRPCSSGHSLDRRSDRRDEYYARLCNGTNKEIGIRMSLKQENQTCLGNFSSNPRSWL